MANRPITATDAITALALGATAYAIGVFVADCKQPTTVVCAGCGVRGQWTDDHTVINASGTTAPLWCTFNPTARKRRAHGPWVPEPRK